MLPSATTSRRGSPLNPRRTPCRWIFDDSDVELFMAVWVHIKDLKMCVTIGERLVSEYRFRRRGGFQVGGSSNTLVPPTIDLTGATPTFLANESLSIPEALDVWEGYGGKDAILYSERVLKEIFNDRELAFIMENSYPIPQPKRTGPVIEECLSSTNSTDARSCNTPSAVLPRNNDGVHLYDSSDTDPISVSFEQEDIRTPMKNAISLGEYIIMLMNHILGFSCSSFVKALTICDHILGFW